MINTFKSDISILDFFIHYIGLGLEKWLGDEVGKGGEKVRDMLQIFLQCNGTLLLTSVP